MIGDKDQDGFYWGELRGRRGFVPHNMVTEIDENQIGAQSTSATGGIPSIGGIGGIGGITGIGSSSTTAGPTNTTATGGTVQQSVRGVSRDRWGDIYANMPVKRMIALYDYDPQELSPNVDAEVCVIQCKIS